MESRSLACKPEGSLAVFVEQLYFLEELQPIA